MEADRQMADAIQKDEEANQVRFEVGRAEYPGKERAENLYAQHEKRRAEEREESRRTRQQEEKERAKKGAARDSKRKAERGKEELGRKEREVKIAERAAPSKRYSRRLSMSQEQIAEYERALAETDAQLQRERAAVEQRERDERATLLVEQQKTTGYYSTRCPPPTTYTIVDEGPVDDRHSSIDRTNNVYRDYPLIAFGRSNQRKVPIVQHKAPNPWDNYHTWEQERLRARTHLERKEGASERGLLRGVETVRRPTPRSGDARRSTPTSPATNSVREQPLLSNQSRQLSVSPFTQLDEVDTHFQDMLGDDINSEGIKHAIDSLEPHKSLSSVDNMRDVTGKAPELPKQLLPNSVSPIILPHTESILANNQLLDMQDVPDDMGEYDTSKPRESIATSSTSSSVTVPLPVQNHPTPGKDHNGDDPETGRHTELVESSRGAEKLVRISQPERMEQVELSLLPSNISTEVADCTTRDDYLNINPGINVVKELTILSKPNKSDMPEVSTFVDSLSTSDRSGCQLENCCDSSTSAAEEEIDSFFETGEESDGASEKCEAGVKSALDTAMNVVKSLLLRELLDCALPQATDTPEELGSSGSGSHTGSASSAASSSHSSRTSGSQTPQRRKRTRSNGRDPGDEDGDDSEDDDRPKKKNEKGSPDRLPHRRLKCPFYQRQPEKYKKAACRGEGFVDMAKLKDHIKRVHMQPLRCSRCWMEMESEDAYSEHLQQEDSCKRKAEPQEDRIRPQVLKRLNFKKAPYTNARNVEEKWNMLFLVLFPDDTSIPSPCMSNLLTHIPDYN
jgi:hypothetical protein